MSLIYQITKKSNHLISKSISQYIKNNFKDLKDYQVSNYQVFDSLGLKAKINNEYILAGNKLFLEKNGININNIEISSSVLLIAINNSFIGYFQLEDKLKEEAKEVIQKLKQKNINQIIISGDNEAITKKISNQLGIPYKANMSLEDRKQFIQDLQKNQIVTMVGDGLNDVLALNQSDVSISFTTSETITIKSSDILLNNQNLKSIIHLINISKKYKKLIKQNIILSLAYNALTIPLAIMGYVTPLISAISMSLSSILVVLNSIIRMKFNK